MQPDWQLNQHLVENAILLKEIDHEPYEIAKSDQWHGAQWAVISDVATYLPDEAVIFGYVSSLRHMSDIIPTLVSKEYGVPLDGVDGVTNTIHAFIASWVAGLLRYLPAGLVAKAEANLHES